jgi:hypothetical protein
MQNQTFQQLKGLAFISSHLKQCIQGWSFQLHINWNSLKLGIGLIQLDDDGWKFCGGIC